MLLAYSISTDWPQQIKIKSVEGKTECPIKKMKLRSLETKAY